MFFPQVGKSVVEGKNGHQCVSNVNSDPKEFKDLNMSVGFRDKGILGENCSVNPKKSLD